MGAPLTAKYSLELGFSFNTRLGKNLELWRNAVINQDIDCHIVGDGAEGAGKSVHLQQVACFLDIEHSIDVQKQVLFTADEVRKAIRELPKFKAIIWDEAGEGTDRRESTLTSNIEFNKMLKKARQYNKFLILVLPSFYDMDMYASVWRTRALIHVWYEWDLENREAPLKRGFARFYNEKGKKKLYTNKRWRQEYNYPFLNNHSFDYTFPKHYVVSESEYRDKKVKAEEEHEKAYEAKKGKRCPQCQGTVRFNHTKKSWFCKVCDWSGALSTSSGITNNKSLKL